MKSFNQSEILESLESIVEKHLARAIEVYQNLSEEQLLAVPPQGGWSLAQILEHLNRYGEYYIPRIKSAVEKGKNYPPNNEIKSSWLGNYFVKTMDPDTGSKKYKAFKEYNPGPDLDVYLVVATFIRQQEELLEALRLARTADLNKPKIDISISRWIKMSVGDAFRFIIAHNERHYRQAERGMGRGKTGEVRRER